MTSPPRAAGIRRLTGFSRKSGASAGRKGEHPTVIQHAIAVPTIKTSPGHVLRTSRTIHERLSAPLPKIPRILFLSHHCYLAAPHTKPPAGLLKGPLIGLPVFVFSFCNLFPTQQPGILRLKCEPGTRNEAHLTST